MKNHSTLILYTTFYFSYFIFSDTDVYLIFPYSLCILWTPRGCYRFFQLFQKKILFLVRIIIFFLFDFHEQHFFHSLLELFLFFSLSNSLYFLFSTLTSKTVIQFFFGTKQDFDFSLFPFFTYLMHFTIVYFISPFKIT